MSVNLEQKTKYKYIVPATEDVLQSIEKYKNKRHLSDDEVRAHFLILTVSEFNPFILDTVTYNGLTDHRQAFAAPVSSENQK